MKTQLQISKTRPKKALLGLFLAGVILTGTSTSWATTGPYTSTIRQLQATSIGSHYNTVFLTIDITDSPCASTNTHNRFTVASNAQHSVILAAVMANKTIIVTGRGVCNSAGIEILNTVVIKP